ncbi:MAG: YeeE/YedE family protein [Proteobacteria bacterium]|jgi:uncharacterized protein|nr:YeeE/YedE family protein [Pseudomonadota bacterium]
MKAIAAFLCGLMLGVGLIVSQMTNPAKVIAFLDVTGHWDPSLALVMGSALLAAFAGFAWVERRGRPFLSGELALPPRWPVDRPLLGGAALFGIGWGIGGFCPGPALVGTAALSADAAVFTAAMLVGMFAANRLAAAASARRTFSRDSSDGAQ